MTKEQWIAIKNHDETYDGTFYYAIRSSGKVCRPSCRKKSYNPKRILIFDSLEQALDLGYQACTRCHPELPQWEGPQTELANAAERIIRQRFREKFSLTQLAEELHVNKSYLLRTYKQVKGSTLLEMHNRIRCETAKELLTHPEFTISYVSSEIGFVSPSHFSKVFRQYTGISPSQYRSEYLLELDEDSEENPV